MHCIAFPHSCTVWRVRLHLRLPVTLHLQYICLIYVFFKLFAIHACHNYEHVGKSIWIKTHMRFTSRSYTNIKSVSPSFRHKMRSGRGFAAIGCDQTDRFRQGYSLLTYSVARSSFWLREASSFEPGAGTVTWAIGKTSIEKCDLRVKVIVFGSSLYRFTVYPDCIICIPWQTACGKPFYTSTSASEACLTTLRFLLQRSNCMVWYDTCQCNCKSQLHHPFSNSETSLNSVVGRSGWALTATCSMPFIHSPASGQQTITMVQCFCLGYLHLGERSPNRTCRCRCAGVPEMNQDWLKQWSAAKEYA